MESDLFGTAHWPWARAGVRVLPVLHGRLETARAVRAHLEAVEPEVVVLEIPRPFAAALRTAIDRLPAAGALRAETAGGPRWLLVEPTDGVIEAARWARAHGARVVCADLFVPDYPPAVDALPDPAVIPEVGWVNFVRAVLHRPPFPPASEIDRRREQAIASAIDEQAAAGLRAVAIVGLAHLRGVLDAPAARGVLPLPPARPPRAVVPVPLDPASLVEIWTEPPYVSAAWERARRGDSPIAWDPPPRAARGRGRREPDPPETPVPGDPLRRSALWYRLVLQAGRLARETGGVEPRGGERRVLHRFASRLAALRGHLCPDLYELVVAARGAVDDAFARDLFDLAAYWPFDRGAPGAVRLSAADLGRDARMVRLRPRIDRLSARRGFVRALERLGETLDERPTGICSHLPEDLVVEGLGARVRSLGARRTAGGGDRAVPLVASLLDGLDARETLRRWLVDGRPWVRERQAVRAGVGAVVVLWDEDREDPPRFPWCQVWHGEHENESDMAFYATDPAEGFVAPGIHRAEYGGFLMIWPPWRLGDVWHDPAYAIARDKAERLVVAGLDYAREPLVAMVSPRPPRSALRALARRLGRRLVHVPIGTLPPDTLRRVRRFHVLADKRLRPIAAHLIDPP